MDKSCSFLELRVEQQKSFYQYYKYPSHIAVKEILTSVDRGFLKYTIFQEICGNLTYAQTSGNVVTRHSFLLRMSEYEASAECPRTHFAPVQYVLGDKFRGDQMHYDTTFIFILIFDSNTKQNRICSHRTAYNGLESLYA